MSLDPQDGPLPPGTPSPPPAPADSPTQPDLRLVELVAAFSLVSDLALGHPSDEVMRACLLATALARRMDLPEAEVSDVYWTTLLAHSGCTAFAHEQAALFGGDEIAVNALGTRTDFQEPREALAFLRELTRGRPAIDRLRIAFNAITAGKRFDEALATANCEVAATLAARIGLGATVERSLLQLFERWDGKGAPNGLQGEDIARPARFAELAHQVAVFGRIGGTEAAVDMVGRRGGAALDPAIAGTFTQEPAPLMEALQAPHPWSALLAAEPAPGVRIPPDRLDGVAAVFADIVDLKSPLLMGHSRGVAALAEAAARELGLPDGEVRDLRVAALLHDLGRAAVPSGIWEKAGPLTQAEWEQVRLHPYHSERILARTPALANLAPIAGMHHERLDGSGYHGQLAGPAIGVRARVLAAADAYRAMTEPRRHREAFEADETADRLAADAEAGRLDRGAVEAVLAAAGAGRRPGRPSQAGILTERETEVLCLIARGHTNREVGRRLFISPKTVGRHVEHIYGKLGIRSRAAAALYASTNGLVEEVRGAAS